MNFPKTMKQPQSGLKWEHHILAQTIVLFLDGATESKLNGSALACIWMQMFDFLCVCLRNICRVYICTNTCTWFCHAVLRYGHSASLTDILRSIHAQSAVSKVKGYHRVLTNMPAAAPRIWFCVQQRHSELYTTCPALVSETACPFLLGPQGRWAAGRKSGGKWMGDRVGGQYSACHLATVCSERRNLCTAAGVQLKARCPGSCQQVVSHHPRPPRD